MISIWDQKSYRGIFELCSPAIALLHVCQSTLWNARCPSKMFRVFKMCLRSASFLSRSIRICNDSCWSSSWVSLTLNHSRWLLRHQMSTTVSQSEGRLYSRFFPADSDGWAALPRCPLGLLHLTLPPSLSVYSTAVHEVHRGGEMWRDFTAALIKIQYFSVFPHTLEQARAGAG